MAYTNNNQDEKRQEEEEKEVINLPSFHPVVLGTPETSVTFDTDSTGSEDIADQLSLPDQALSPGSTVHIESSTDVVIGPMTQFHGPVTIYQNINSDNAIEDKKVTKPENFNNNTKANASEIKSTKTHQTVSEILVKTSNKRLCAYSVIILTTMITFILGITLSLKLYKTHDEPQDHTTVTPASPSLTSHPIYDKDQWGGRPALNFTKVLVHPVDLVLISHTAGRVCKTFSVCSSIMQQIQSMHVTNNSPDIGYNFLIGGDGAVYVGRGWDIINFHGNGSIGISFIGNYVYDEVTPSMKSALEDLLNIGVKLKKLSSDYKLVCHNQTFATLSPGQNVYKVISLMPHFYPERV